MPIGKQGQQQEYKKLERVTRDELIGKAFFVDRQGKPFDGRYGTSVPLNITTQDGDERVFWASGLLANQATENQMQGGTYTIEQRTSAKTRRNYFTFVEVEV